MKTIKVKLMTLAGFAGLFFVILMSSCAVKTPFLTSAVVPAAQGTVQVKNDKNKNYVIKIEIKNLSPSNRLTPPSLAYVIWAIANDNSTQNLGQINSSDDFMASDLSISFETVSSLKPSKIVITAENDPSVQNPSFSQVILTTDFLKVK